MATPKQFLREYVKAIRDGNAAVFAGAGLSRPSGFVDWKELLRPLADDIDLNIDEEHDLAAVAQYVRNKAGNRAMNCSPSRGQRKNIKFSRPAAKCCWPLFMQQSTTCVFLSVSARPSYAGLFWCCNNGCSTQSFARVPVCW